MVKSTNTKISAVRGNAAAPQSTDGAAAGRAEKVGVSIVVPCFNEEPTIPTLAERLAGMQRKLNRRYRVVYVFVDDGSTDGTWTALRRAFGHRPDCTILRHERNRGVAAAIATGIRHAQTDIVCSLDADCTYDPEGLCEMIPQLTHGVDLVTASPYHKRGQVLNVPGWRLMSSRLVSLLYRRALRQKLCCYTSCFRVYRRSAVVDIELKHGGFVGIAELVWKLDRRGTQIVEFPAVLNARRLGKSKMNFLATAAGHARLLGRILGERIRSVATAFFKTGGPSAEKAGRRGADQVPR